MVNDMRAVVIHAPIRELRGLPTWKLIPFASVAGGPRGARTYGVSKHGVMITLDETTPGITQTLNVIPHDQNDDRAAASHALRDLADELDAAGFDRQLSASAEARGLVGNA
ncbi:hypothetical protein [Burkholderia plantarii]|uniref:hypothetical protein n=1 Tax=Burkholderia plantarii TaxID=41899 RepID=UPI000870A26D|nr:hypothetical protein [Burkholderia plantarii]